MVVLVAGENERDDPNGSAKEWRALIRGSDMQDQEEWCPEQAGIPQGGLYGPNQSSSPSASPEEYNEMGERLLNTEAGEWEH